MRELKIPVSVNGKIINTLRAVLPDLPVALARLAQYILDNTNDVTSQNVTEVATSAGVGEATVVRLAKFLKMQGYKEFQLELAKEIAGSAVPSSEEQILDSDISNKDDCTIIARKLKYAINCSLNENIRSLDEKTLRKVAEAIYKAHKVYIVGVGNSCLSALFFKNKLCRIGLDAMCEPMNHFQYTGLAILKRKDVVIALSQRGSSYETIKSVQIGKANGAVIVVITNNLVSKLTQYADYVIYNGNEEGALQGDSAATIAAQIHICEVLYTLVVSFNRSKAIKTKQITLQALNKRVSEDSEQNVKSGSKSNPNNGANDDHDDHDGLGANDSRDSNDSSVAHDSDDGNDGSVSNDSECGSFSNDGHDGNAGHNQQQQK